MRTEARSSVDNVNEQDLRTGGRWFDPRLGQYSFRRLMIVVVTGFIALSPTTIVSTKVTLESRQRLGQNIVRSTIPAAINNASPKVHDVVFAFLTKGII